MKIAPRKVVNVAVLPSHWQQAILLLPVPVRTIGGLLHTQIMVHENLLGSSSE